MVPVLTFFIAVVAFIGPVEMRTQNYTGEIDLAPGDGILQGEAISADMRIEKATFPAATANLTFDPGKGGIWILIVSARTSSSLVMTNESGSISVEFTSMTAVGIGSLEYFTATNCFYWINSSAVAEPFRILIQEEPNYAFPVFTVESLPGNQAVSIPVVARFRPAVSPSEITVSVLGLSIHLNDRDTINSTGPTILTIGSYESAYLHFATVSHPFPVHPGARISWFDGPMTLSRVSGIVTSGTGEARKFLNASLRTLDIPRKVTFEMGPVPTDPQKLSMALEFEGTTVQVLDATGANIVGLPTQDLIPVPGWPRPLKGPIILALAAVLLIFSMAATLRRD